ncbi:hypothetical protein EV647_8088 [Kribbella sp. VKM Ac-2566]|nr:hypothetical protein EV647_8088 [Kribbella sp. VKM Ac-2566]
MHSGGSYRARGPGVGLGSTATPPSQPFGKSANVKAAFVAPATVSGTTFGGALVVGVGLGVLGWFVQAVRASAATSARRRST